MKERKLGRPRSSESHEAILSAVGAVLRAKGLQGLTLDTVIADAKVSKATIYRRWDSMNTLAMDAILQIFNSELRVPETGSAVNDLRSLMRQFAAVLQNGGLGYTYVSLLVAAQQSHTIEQLHERFFSARRKVFYEIIRRGVKAGEFPADVDPDLINDVLFGPIIFRLLTGLKPIDDDMISSVLEIVSQGTRKAAHIFDKS
ncbi:TetR/AcrR family transcriptional regulator [Neorhizobium galegae]|nr:TetR/AcrR family transcriptional regulator [Neorhizobium galegae]